MTGAGYLVLSSVLTFGVPIVLAVCELLDLTGRDDGGARGAGEPKPPPLPPPPRRGAPPGPALAAPPRPLPECLIPKPASRLPASRQLEEV